MSQADITAPDLDLVSYPDSTLSDDSSFYGDEELKASFKNRSKRYNPEHFWEIQQWNLQSIAAEHIEPKQFDLNSSISNFKHQSIEVKYENTHKNAVDHDPEPTHSQSSTIQGDEPEPHRTQKASSPHNPYEGDMMAKQLDENIEEFLTRLAPSKTTIETGPWIWIVDPFSQNQRLSIDYAGFKKSGFELLDRYRSRKRSVEENNPGASASTITRLLYKDRIQLEKSILKIAKSKNVISGKWMVFPSVADVDKIWGLIARSTLEGKLGCSAKVSTEDGGPKAERVVCIYTDDFSDTNDVKRVLKEMQRLELVKSELNPKPLYYKCDAYTYLDIVSGNEYKLKVSMYSSRDLFKEMESQ